MIPHSIHGGKIRRLLSGRMGLLAVLSAIFAAPAQAQTVDYGALEKLFGESVTTSATGQPQRVTDVPAAMEIVPADQIRRSGAVDIPGVLKHVPGVDVLQWGTDNSDLSVRGYNQAYSPRLLVLVDGRKVFADHYGYTPWTAVPVELSAIRQIEVVKGPNTALFGFNAVSGVINIITYNPLYDDVNTVSVTGGSQGTIRGSAVATIQDKGRWGLRLSGSAGLDNDFSTMLPAYVGATERLQNTRFALAADGVAQLSKTIQLGLEVETRSNDIDPAYTLSQDRHFTTSVKSHLDVDTGLGMVQLLAYTNWIEQKASNALRVPIDFDNQSSVIQLQDVLQLGSDHVVRAAVEFRHNQVNTTPVSGGRVSYDGPSYSGMWNWTISPTLSWTSAVRFDSLALHRSGSVPPGYPFDNSDWDRTFSESSFNTGLGWKVSDKDTLRLLVSRGIQLPSLANFGAFVITTPQYNSTGSPLVDDAEVMNFELDWDRKIESIGALLRGAVFWQKTTEVISLSGGDFYPGPPPYNTMGNIGNSDALGGEISLRGTFAEQWLWGLSYRFENIKDKFVPMAQGAAAFTDFQHTTPKHQVKANIGWSNATWEADMAFYYQSANSGLFPLPTGPTALTPISAYGNADARIGYRINGNLTLSLSGDNLLTARQRQTSGPEVQRRVFLNLLAAY